MTTAHITTTYDHLLAQATAAISAQRYQEALVYAQRVLQHDAEHIQALTVAASALSMQGRGAEAELLFAKALKLSKRAPSVLAALGMMYRTQRRWPEMMAAFNEVLKQDADFEMAYAYMGESLYQQGQIDTALKLYEHLIQRFPRNPYGWVYAARIRTELGDKAKVAALCKEGLHAVPHSADLFYALVSVEKLPLESEFVATAEQLMEDEGMGPLGRSIFGFGLFEHYHAHAQYDKAFAFLHRANGLKQQHAPHDREWHRQSIASLMVRPLPPEPPATAAAEARAYYGITPIFIVGMPRSGTSLVEQVLASHPQVYGGGELSYLHEVFATEQLQPSIPHAKEALAGWRPEFQDYYRKLGDTYLNRLRPKLKAGEDFITDKMPNHFLHVGMIRLLFPHARILFTKRDAMDTCFSIYSKNFEGSLSYAYDQRSLAEYYQWHLELMAYWQERFPAQIYRVEYENFVDDFAAQAPRLLDFCGLSHHEACFNFHETKRAVRTLSALQVSKPLHKSSGNWKPYEAYLSELREGLK